jgi:hypothetical protein
VYNITSVDDADASLNSTVQNAMERAIPRGVTKNLNSLIGSPLPYDIIFQKRITTIDVLKR